jgi:hypothetical protein
MMTHHDRPLRSGYIAPASEFVARARDTIDFERGAGAEFDPNDVPEQLGHLIPFARRWAFADCGKQAVFIEHLQETASRDIDAFISAMRPHEDDLRDWFKRLFAAHGPVGWPAAANAFVNTLEMYDLVKPLDPALIQRNRREHEEYLRRQQQRDDIEASRAAMTRRDFAEVVRLLSPYESELEGADRRRLEIAQKRV